MTKANALMIIVGMLLVLAGTILTIYFLTDSLKLSLSIGLMLLGFFVVMIVPIV